MLSAAAIIAGNWLLFVMPWVYNPASLAHLLKVAGMPARHEDMWALVDLASITLLAWSCRHLWWSVIIAGAYLGALALHVVAANAGLDYEQYETFLDAALVLQLAVIFVVGGRGLADLVFHWSRVRGLHLLGRTPVEQREEASR